MDFKQFYDDTQQKINSIERRLNNFTAIGGQANTASNIGVGGIGLYQQKVGVDLQFRNINAASARISVALDAGNNEVDIDAVEAQINHDNLLNFVAAEHIDWTNAAANFLTTGTLDCGGPLTITQNADTIVFSHDGTDPFVRWSDGSITFQTDEGVNTATRVLIKPKGAHNVTALRFYDAGGLSFDIWSDNLGSYIESTLTTLHLNRSYTQNIYCWADIAAGTPAFILYGWETGVALRSGRFYVGGDGFFHVGAERGAMLFELEGGNAVFTISSTDAQTGRLRDASGSARLIIEAEGTDKFAGIELIARDSVPADKSWYIDNRGGVDGAPDNSLKFFEPGAVAACVIFHEGALVNTLVVDSNSYVGIGTADPGTKLEVIGTGTFQAQNIGSVLMFEEIASNESRGALNIWSDGTPTGGYFGFYDYGGEAWHLGLQQKDGCIFLNTIKKGATQAAAGAAANEVWKTSGHATLPNDVLMIGV